MTNVSRPAVWWWIGLGGLASSSIAAILWICERGIGLSPDSAVYVAAARSLAAGQGVLSLSDAGEMAPMTNFPPLFPLLLAPFGLAGVDAIEAARWLNAVLLAVNVALGAVLVRRASASRPAGLFAGVLLLVSVPMLQTHAMAWSEPTFFAFLLLGFLGLGVHLERGGDASLLGAACAFGLGWMTRYAGAAAVASAAVAIVLFVEPRRRALRSAALLASVAAAPTLAWMARNSAVLGSLTGRERGFHPPNWSDLEMGRDTIAAWVWPIDPRSIAAPCLAAAFLVFSWIARRRAREPARAGAALPWVLVIFAGVHVATVAASRAFADADIQFDTRTLSPAYVALLLAGVGAATRRGRDLDSRLAAAALALIALSVGGAHASFARSWAFAARIRGQGFDSPAWRGSQLIEMIRRLPERSVVVSNANDAVYLVAGRATRRLPQLVDRRSLGGSRDFDRQLGAMRDALAGGGVIVYFERMNWRWYLPTEARLQELLPLRVVRRDAEGTVLELVSPAGGDSSVRGGSQAAVVDRTAAP